MKSCYVLENNFSFHTLEFTQTINKKTFDKIYNHLTKNYGIRCKSNKNATKKYLYFDWSNLKYSGVRVVLKKPIAYIKEGFFNYSIKLIINPRSLINNTTEYWGIFNTTSENVTKLISLLNEVIWDIGLVNENDSEFYIKSFGTIEKFTLTRIDFCVNIIFNSTNIAEDYLEILSRSDLYNFGNNSQILKLMKSRHKQYKNELFYQYKSFNLKIYNKLKQMESIGKSNLIPNEYNGYLRFEMSINKNKIKYIKNKYDYGDNLSLFLLNASRESKKQFKRYVTYLFKTGYIMNLDNAKKYINFNIGNLINQTQAKELINFIELVSKKRSIYKAKEYIDSKITEKRLFKLFHLINLNPITIPRRWNKKGNNYDILPSPYIIMKFEDDPLFDYS